MYLLINPRMTPTTINAITIVTNGMFVILLGIGEAIDEPKAR